MIRKFWILLKIQMLGFFGINRMMHSREKNQKRQVVIMGVAWLCVFAVFLMYSALVSYGCAKMGAAHILPVFMLTVSSLITMVLTFFKVNGLLFSFKDHDMVMSLPVSSITVILSRLSTICIMSFLICLIAEAPSAVIYGYYMDAAPSVYLMQGLGMFLAPLVPITVACAAGAIIMAASARFRYKNIIALTLSMILLLTVVLLSVSMNEETPQMLIDVGVAIDRFISQVYPLAYLYRKAVVESDWGSFGLFVLVSIGFAALFVSLLEKYYHKINTALFAHTVRSGYRIDTTIVKSPFKALYYKELRRLISCTVYALNTCFGILLVVVLAVLSLFSDPVQVSQLLGFGDVIGDYVLCFPFVIALFVGISSTTSSSISLEGKSRWLMCSVPVIPDTVYKAKIAVNLTVLLPSVIISSILFSVALQMNLQQMLFMLILPAVYSVFISVLGLFFNIKYPKYDWTSEYHAVKNSFSVLCTVTIGILLPVILLTLNLLIIDHAFVFQFSSTVIILLVTYGLYARIKNKRLYM